MENTPAIVEAKSAIAAEKKKARRGLCEIATGICASAGLFALVVTDPFREMIATPGIEHYVGGTLKYGTYIAASAGIFLLAKGVYDAFRHGARAERMEEQLEVLRKDIMRRHSRTSYSDGRSQKKTRNLYDPDDLDKLRTKRKPPFNPMLF